MRAICIFGFATNMFAPNVYRHGNHLTIIVPLKGGSHCKGFLDITKPHAQFSVYQDEGCLFFIYIYILTQPFPNNKECTLVRYFISLEFN